MSTKVRLALSIIVMGILIFSLLYASTAAWIMLGMGEYFLSGMMIGVVVVLAMTIFTGFTYLLTNVRS